MNEASSVWLEREVRLIDRSIFPMNALVGPDSVVVRETTSPLKNRTLRGHPLASLIAATEGESYFVIGGRTIHMRRGEILLRPAYLSITHRGKTGENFSSKYLCVSGPMADFFDILNHQEQPFVHLESPDQKLFNDVCDVVDLAFQPTDKTLGSLASKLVELCRLLSENIPELLDQSSIDRRLNSAIRGDWRRAISVDEAASLLCMSRVELYQQFKDELGISPGRWGYASNASRS